MSKTSTTRLSKLPTEKWNGYTTSKDKADDQKIEGVQKQERRKQYGAHIKRLSTRPVPENTQKLTATTIGKANTFKSNN